MEGFALQTTQSLFAIAAKSNQKSLVKMIRHFILTNLLSRYMYFSYIWIGKYYYEILVLCDFFKCYFSYRFVINLCSFGKGAGCEADWGFINVIYGAFPAPNPRTNLFVLIQKHWIKKSSRTRHYYVY